MSHLGSWLEDAPSLVGDASVWINLVATGHAEELLRLSTAKHLITTAARTELESGRAKGRQAAEAVAELIALGLINEVALTNNDEAVFIDLVAGPTGSTLDDGEAATIAFAIASTSVALIDERKATALCNDRYPALLVMSTTDFLLAPPIVSGLQEEGISECFFRALTVARMRVPDRHLVRVCELLGSERRQMCRSLPAALRQGTEVSGHEPLLGR